MKNVITFGTFDLFHYDHLRILERAASLGDKLIVGVFIRFLNFIKKTSLSYIQRTREIKYNIFIKMRVLRIFKEVLELKRDYLLKYQANFWLWEDWKGEFDCFNDICDVIYFERTPSISTTEIIERIKL